VSSPAATVAVPAKLNVGLAVGSRRPDGYHPVDTVFTALSLHDTVTAEPAAEPGLRLTGQEVGSVPADRTNLAWRAAELLADRLGRAPAVLLRIDKRIPVAAGLAGGSADAAGALLACRQLWQPDLPTGELAVLAARLGSDVNFALVGGTARGTGRGELLTALPAPELHWVLAAADGELSTAEVYARFDQLETATDDPALPDALLAAVLAGDPARLAGQLRNDLQPAAVALAPYLEQTLAAGLAAGALGGLVSGSGPTCAFLTRGPEHAGQVAEALSRSGSCRFAVPVRGGVPGPATAVGSTTENGG